jgi:hypothetical protein
MTMDKCEIMFSEVAQTPGKCISLAIVQVCGT